MHEHDIARKALHRTLPNRYVDISVDTAAKVDLKAVSSVDLTGRWVRFEAVGDGVCFLRGDHVSGMTATKGIVLTAGDFLDDVWIYPDGETELTTIKVSSACTLRVYYDVDAIGG